MAKTKRVRFSKVLVEKICESVAQDVSVAELFRKNPEAYPHPTTFSTWMSTKGDEIREMYEAARRLQMSTIDDKYTDLLNNPPPITGDKIADSHSRDVWRTQLNHLERRLARLAPIFNAKYDKAQKVEHQGEVSGPTIVIQSYPEELLSISTDKDNKVNH